MHIIHLVHQCSAPELTLGYVTCVEDIELSINNPGPAGDGVVVTLNPLRAGATDPEPNLTTVYIE